MRVHRRERLLELSLSQNGDVGVVQLLRGREGRCPMSNYTAPNEADNVQVGWRWRASGVLLTSRSKSASAQRKTARNVLRVLSSTARSRHVHSERDAKSSLSWTMSGRTGMLRSGARYRDTFGTHVRHSRQDREYEREGQREGEGRTHNKWLHNVRALRVQGDSATAKSCKGERVSASGTTRAEGRQWRGRRGTTTASTGREAATADAVCELTTAAGGVVLVGVLAHAREGVRLSPTSARPATPFTPTRISMIHAPAFGPAPGRAPPRFAWLRRTLAVYEGPLAAQPITAVFRSARSRVGASLLKATLRGTEPEHKQKQAAWLQTVPGG
ncbi:hypothetical protein EXIGLDRAFT_821396 [Exidia glandulosa HHB12029]|uniref:Uncharacterized protein n=1 Tax=Exidia glandulosa HHB12029 TaxID=1314781 RepID=A0A165PKK2_EXIGL|nr:hypothetical protein EXIGLDRAFT_821396 [Exidia glandulosa HHB12029]